MVNYLIPCTLQEKKKLENTHIPKKDFAPSWTLVFSLIQHFLKIRPPLSFQLNENWLIFISWKEFLKDYTHSKILRNRNVVQKILIHDFLFHSIHLKPPFRSTIQRWKQSYNFYIRIENPNFPSLRIATLPENSITKSPNIPKNSKYFCENLRYL